VKATYTPPAKPTATPVPPTDTPKRSPPAAPKELSITEGVCNSQEYSFKLAWLDVATNEDGYRIYRDKQLIATLKASSASFAESPPDSDGHSYAVEAFNQAGSSSQASVQDGGCVH